MWRRALWITRQTCRTQLSAAESAATALCDILNCFRPKPFGRSQVLCMMFWTLQVQSWRKNYCVTSLSYIPHSPSSSFSFYSSIFSFLFSYFFRYSFYVELICMAVCQWPEIVEGYSPKRTMRRSYLSAPSSTCLISPTTVIMLLRWS